MSWGRFLRPLGGLKAHRWAELWGGHDEELELLGVGPPRVAFWGWNGPFGVALQRPARPSDGLQGRLAA